MIADCNTELEQINLDRELSNQQTNQNKLTKHAYKNLDNEVENSTNKTHSA